MPVCLVPFDDRRERLARGRLRHTPIQLNNHARCIVRSSMAAVAEHRGWTIHAISVRTNHVHIVVTADRAAERVMNDFKAWSSTRLLEGGVFPRGTVLWVRHGSTRYLWTTAALHDACRYVVEGQGHDLPGSA